jgi:hypothetical protein
MPNKKSLFAFLFFYPLALPLTAQAQSECVSQHKVEVVFDCVALSGLVLQATNFIQASKTEIENTNTEQSYLKRTWEVRRDFGREFASSMSKPEFKATFYNPNVSPALGGPIRYYQGQEPQDTSAEGLKRTLNKQTSDFIEGLKVLVELQRSICNELNLI